MACCKDKDVSRELTCVMTIDIQEPLLQPAVVTVLANLNKSLLLGYLLGGLTGTYIQQTYLNLTTSSKHALKHSNSQLTA